MQGNLTTGEVTVKFLIHGADTKVFLAFLTRSAEGRNRGSGRAPGCTLRAERLARFAHAADLILQAVVVVGPLAGVPQHAWRLSGSVRVMST